MYILPPEWAIRLLAQAAPSDFWNDVYKAGGIALVFVCLAVLGFLTGAVAPKWHVTKMEETNKAALTAQAEAHKETITQLKEQHAAQVADLRMQIAEEKAERAQAEKMAKTAVEGLNRLTKRIEGDGEAARRK